MMVVVVLEEVIYKVVEKRSQCWLHSLIYTQSLMFFSVRASGTLLIHLTLSTEYLYYSLLS